MDNRRAGRKIHNVPYFVNQERLLDIYAILNSDYTEYEEALIAPIDEKWKSAVMEADVDEDFSSLDLGFPLKGILKILQLILQPLARKDSGSDLDVK